MRGSDVTLTEAKDRLRDLADDEDTNGKRMVAQGETHPEKTVSRRMHMSAARAHWANAEAIRLVLAELDRGGK